MKDEFKNEDERWRAEAHRWPFALNFRRASQGLLHAPERCPRINPQTPASHPTGGLTTYRAKYTFDDRAEAVACCVERTGRPPVPCKTCNP